MKIGNRANMTIMRARMTRLAKTKVFTGRRNTSHSSNHTTAGKNQSLSELLSSLYNKDKTSSTDKLIENRTQTLLYKGMQTSAERVQSHLEKFQQTGETSIFGQADQTKAAETAKSEAKGFINDYNLMMGRLNSSKNSADKNNATKLMGYVAANASALQKVGITQNTNGTLNLDEKKLASADIADLKKVFGDADGFGKKILAQTKLIGTHAEEQLKELAKTDYSVSSNYNRYGNSLGLDSYGSSYNRKA